MAATGVREYGRVLLRRSLSTHRRSSGHKTVKVHQPLVLSRYSVLKSASSVCIASKKWRAFRGLGQGACGGREGRGWVQELQKVRCGCVKKACPLTLSLHCDY